MKETKASLKSSDAPQLLVNGFFGLPRVDLNKQNLNSSGIWQLQISLDNEGPILTRDFLVLPLYNPLMAPEERTTWHGIISKFWVFNSMCLLGNSRFNAVNEFVKDCKSTYWSSEYPDPKSEFNVNNLETNRLNRI